MKKNVVGHMVAQKEPVGKRIRRLGIFPFIVCLLLALIVWLAVYEVNNKPETEPPTEASVVDTELLL